MITLKRLSLFLCGMVILLSATTHSAFAQVNEEAEVREHFADIPVMIEIARCESKFRQFTDSGSVLRGGYGGGMIGVFQFNEAVHQSAADALGHDLATLDGNLAYARHLYEQQGTQPWSSVQTCFQAVGTPTSPTPTAGATPARGDAELREKIALLQELLKLLQTLLALRLSASGAV